jgi:uroporphyrinogen III methyltransferase/synthase
MSGIVYLVGAGPGDQGLLTLRAKEVLEMANVVVYDRLVSSAILRMASPKAEKIYVGKAASNHAMQQEDINQLLVDKAKAGHTVVRLKGGDPYVFGRGGEEGEKLFQENVEFEVVPGVTSAIAGLAYAGIPITHRDLASSFHVFTGHFKDDDHDHDWETISKLAGTKVFLMGVGNLEMIMDKLLSNGTNPNMPVAIVSNATRGTQKVLTSTAENILKDSRKAEIKPPSLLVIGEVVKMRETLSWFEKRPLFGQEIVVTRATAQSSQLVGRLKALGAGVIELPAIKIQPRARKEFQSEIDTIQSYNWVIFTSENAVSIFMDGLFASGKDARSLADVKIAVMGSGTERRLQQYGIRADIKPVKFIAESLIEALTGKLHAKDRVLVPRASEARDVLIKWLEGECVVKEIHIYDTLIETVLKPEQLEAVKDADWITFTSASTVKNFFKQIETADQKLSPKTKFASIGPVTSETLIRKGYKADAEAKTMNIDGLIEALTEDKSHEEI